MNELLHHLLNLPPQASSVARGIDYLHYTVIGVTILGVALVAAITLYFIVRFRRAAEAPAVTPRVEAPVWLELGVASALLALFCGWWVIGFAQYRELETPPANAIPIYVTAKQWMWKFEYPGGPASSEVLVVPVGTPVKLIMTSRDVIHGFYVPAFRIKQDVVPGHATSTWFEAIAPGSYDILCTQYCGTRHSFMRAQVVALAPGGLRALGRRGARTARVAGREGRRPGPRRPRPRGRRRARLPALSLARRHAVHRPDVGARIRLAAHARRRRRGRRRRGVPDRVDDGSEREARRGLPGR